MSINRTIDVTANKGEKNERRISVTIQFPETLAEATKVFGESIVFEKFQDAYDVALQAFVRQQLTKNGEKRLTDAKILEAVKGWKPSSRKAADPAKKAESITKAMASMSPAERAALLKQLAAIK